MIQDMQFTIDMEAQTQTIYVVDSANELHGPDIDGNDLCGATAIEISPPDLVYLTFD